MISVVIPTYSRPERLKRNLNTALSLLKEQEFIVVNDNPTQDLAPLFQSDFPSVILHQNKQNGGFSAAANEGISLARHNFILLINDDVILQDAACLALAQRLKHDPTIFAISLKQQDADGLHGKNVLFWEKGLIQHKAASELTSGPTGWAEGGSMIFNRSIFTLLGGFDKLYSPFYWEDVDLSYRAQKAGYSVLFEASVCVTHQHESTIGTHFSSEHISEIAQRNQLMCTWKNVHWTLLLEHIVHMLRMIISTTIRGNTLLIRSVVRALPLLPHILLYRLTHSGTNAVSDRHVLNIIKKEKSL